MNNNKMIETWERCYQRTLPSAAQRRKRLRELETWDKPFGSPSSNGGAWREHVCKRIALENLTTE